MMHSFTPLFVTVFLQVRPLRPGAPAVDVAALALPETVVYSAVTLVIALLVIAVLLLQRRNQHLARENRRLERELQEHQEEIRNTNSKIMEQERLNAMGQIASGIIHDINNSLVPISLYTEALLQESTGLSPEAVDYLNTILESTHDIEHITTRLRAFYQKPSKMDARQPVEWKEVFTQVIAMSRPRWKNMVNRTGAVIDISSEVEPGLPPLWGIVSEIREALLNIILNSVDAMPKGGKIVLSASSSGFHIVIEVRDTGHGMNAEQKQRCLEPFYTTKGAKGTGLGLAAVYGMMQRHGGSIEIDSKVQQGTTIRLLFPIRETDLQHPVPVKPDYKNNTQAERVLYVDDDTVVLDALTHIMTAQGFNVTPVTSAEQALGAFESGLSENQPFDVVVTDLSMPHMSGREIAAKIKKRSPSTPVILLSGWGELASGADEDDPNVDRSFGKPPNIVELARTIGELTAGSP